MIFAVFDVSPFKSCTFVGLHLLLIIRPS